jgi:hypothetical protein
LAVPQSRRGFLSVAPARSMQAPTAHKYSRVPVRLISPPLLSVIYFIISLCYSKKDFVELQNFSDNDCCVKCCSLYIYIYVYIYIKYGTLTKQLSGCSGPLQK